MNYSNLGWINVIILGVLITPYVLNFLNKRFIKTKNKNFFIVVKSFRRFHKPLGIALMVIGLVHGYLALGSLRLHTGTILYLSIFVTGALGGSFHRLKKKALFIWHKRMAFITIAIFLLHLFYPSAIYYLFN